MNRPAGTYVDLATAVLVAHQRREDSNCLCGGLHLGQSWARHVAEVLAQSGALQVPPAYREEQR